MCLACLQAGAQTDSTAGTGPKPPAYKDYKSDSTFEGFNKNRGPVAKAQINRLKGGALLVRLKTNQKAIDQLRASGNIDLATQVERETRQNNETIMRAYRHEFNFCPVYFFYSQYSDSVKQQKLSGIFLDSTLQINPSVVCSAGFYLVAEQGYVVNSSLGLVPLEAAPHAQERGDGTREVAIVLKNRFFIQLQNPFPYYQKGYIIKNYPDYVKRFNAALTKYYTANAGFVIPADLSQFVY